MKKIIITIAAVILMTSCGPSAGTLINVDKANHENIEVYQYFYDDGAAVFIARFGDNKDVTTTSWHERRGKTSVLVGSVSVDTLPETCTLTVSPSYTLTDAVGNTTVITKVK